jgi:DNA-binding transcriptional LysR family regulator
MLNPWRLRILCQLETLGTVRAVAQSMHQSPSSISQQLAALEAELGLPLLQRVGRTVRLTPTGHLLAGRARDILRALEDTEEEFKSLVGSPAGVVRVGAFQSAIHSQVTPAVLSARALRPEVTVRVDEMEPNESIGALVRGDVDLVITITEFVDAPLRNDVTLIPLMADPIVVVAPRGHRVESVEAVDLATLSEELWNLEREGFYIANLATHLCRAAGFEPKVLNRFTNYFTALRHVESGSSIALLPGLAVDPRYDVVTRQLLPRVERRIVVATRSGSAPRPAVNLLLQELRAVAGPDRSAAGAAVEPVGARPALEGPSAAEPDVAGGP